MSQGFSGCVVYMVQVFQVPTESRWYEAKEKTRMIFK